MLFGYQSPNKNFNCKFSGIRVEVNNGTVGPSVIDVDEKTQVRIIRQQSVRVATEGDDVFIYHNFDNPR